MGLQRKDISIKIGWKDFEKTFKLFCNSRNVNGEISENELSQIELENELQLNNEIPNIVGQYAIEKEEVKFYIFEDKIIFRYSHPLKINEQIEFLDLIEEYKDNSGLLLYGVKRELSHYNSRQLIKEDFFWSCTDELAPFGSDEGDLALEDFRNWREKNPDEKMIYFVASYLNGSWKFKLDDYISKRVLDKEQIKQYELDEDFDTHYNYFTLDTCIIATCFGQFIDEGKIDKEIIPILETSIAKIILWSEVKKEDWSYAEEFIKRLNILKIATDEIKKKAAENNA